MQRQQLMPVKSHEKYQVVNFRVDSESGDELLKGNATKASRPVQECGRPEFLEVNRTDCELNDSFTSVVAPWTGKSKHGSVASKRLTTAEMKALSNAAINSFVSEASQSHHDRFPRKCLKDFYHIAFFEVTSRFGK
jgi:hypothetical protein